jgi:hypothetical protein
MLLVTAALSFCLGFFLATCIHKVSLHALKKEIDDIKERIIKEADKISRTDEK